MAKHKISFILMLLYANAIWGNYKDTTEVYIISGQSNATGQGYVVNLDHEFIAELTPWFPRPFEIDTRVQLLYSKDAGGGGTLHNGEPEYTWMPLQNCSEKPDALGVRFGPEIGFGNRMMQLDSNANIAIIKSARSGKSITYFLPDGEGNKYLATAIDSGMGLLAESGKPAVIRGMLWQQGEEDINDANYASKLVNFIDYIRTTWNVPEMFFTYGLVLPAKPDATVRDQQRMVDENSGIQYATSGAFVINTDGYQLRAEEPDSPYPKDSVHFGTAGILKLGKVMADSMFKKLTAQSAVYGCMDTNYSEFDSTVTHPVFDSCLTEGIEHQKSADFTPKLSTGTIQINTPGNYSLKIVNLNGQLVLQKSGIGPENLELTKIKKQGVFIIKGHVNKKTFYFKYALF